MDKETERLIMGYKRDFFSRTGKGLIITIASKKIHDPYSLPQAINIEDTLSMVYDYTKWDRNRIESRVQVRRSGCIEKKVIMFILNKANVPQKYIASIFHLERSTVAKTIIEFRKKLEKDNKLSKLLENIISFINDNYLTYSIKRNLIIG